MRGSALTELVMRLDESGISRPEASLCAPKIRFKRPMGPNFERGSIENDGRGPSRSNVDGGVLDREPPALGRFEVEVSHAQGAGQGNVLRLADVEAFAEILGFQWIKRFFA